MIYSASRRTDMPAFHPAEIANRIRRSRKLDGIVLWTKNPGNIVRHPELRRAIEGIPAIVQLTVTGLAGGAWEPNTPSLETLLPVIREMGAMFPPGAVRWRFDPIIHDSDALARFRVVRSALGEALPELTEVVTSFADPYRHSVARASGCGLAWPTPSPAEKRDVLAAMVGEFANEGIEASAKPVRLCCEPDLLAIPGVGQAHCIDGGLFDRLYGTKLGQLERDSSQRVACGCVKSTDIGSYDMACGHDCRYCYANRNGLNAVAAH